MTDVDVSWELVDTPGTDVAWDLIDTPGVDITWNIVTIDGQSLTNYLAGQKIRRTDVAFHPVDTSGAYPASDIDPIADPAAWLTAGGPAFFNVETGDVVAVNNGFDPTATGIYNWDGATFTRHPDYETTESLDKLLVVSHVHHSHFTGEPLEAPIPLAAMFFADDVDAALGTAVFATKIVPDGDTVIDLITYFGGGGVALGETSSTAYRGDRGKTAYDHSQVVTGNPHGTTAADVGAAATSHTHAASDVTSGTLDIARIPTGTTGSTVPFGNDSRFSDSRTPTAHKTSHATGGGDALAPSDIGAAPTSRTITAGTGLTGGGDLSADRTLAVSYGLTASAAVEGIALPRKAWRAGSYYATDVLPSNSGYNIASGQVKAMAFYNPVAGRAVDQIAIDVHTGSAGSGILYICTDDGTGYPGAVVASGTMSTPTTSTRSTTTISYTLPRGQLWLVAHGTGTTWAGLALYGQSFYMPAPATYSANPISCWNATGAGTSALTSFPAGATAASSGVQILIRAA